MTEEELQLLQIAVALYPFFREELSEQMKREGYTHFLRSELRRRAVREAKELLVTLREKD